MQRTIAFSAGGILVLFLLATHPMAQERQLDLESIEMEEPILEHLYGSGVHAYFNNDYVAAEHDLTRAIETGSRDPRVYYYRGLVYLKTGRPVEADADFRKGANLELKDMADQQQFPVNQSLLRVQGTARLTLEKQRITVQWLKHREAKRRLLERYGGPPVPLEEEPLGMMRDLPPGGGDVGGGEEIFDEDPEEEPAPKGPSPFEKIQEEGVEEGDGVLEGDLPPEAIGAGIGDGSGTKPPADDGLGGLPPADAPGGLPPADAPGGLPPADAPGDLPPADDGLGGLPPADAPGGLPPADAPGDLPPADDGLGGLPPADAPADKDAKKAADDKKTGDPFLDDPAPK